MTSPQEHADELNTSHASPSSLRQSVADGLLYTHSRLNANQRMTTEAASFVYALIELLNERGLLAIEELDERQQLVAQRLAEQVRREGNGALFQDPEYDKYAFEYEAKVDCAARIHACKGACCRLPFALSRQDVREGIVHWELGQPYIIEHKPNGYCTHIDDATCACTIYANRPAPCRGFDCSQDTRIWLDFEQMIPNPLLARPDWPYCLSQEEAGSQP